MNEKNEDTEMSIFPYTNSNTNSRRQDFQI